MREVPIVWSYGGGTQTAAIAVLIRNGVLPAPDITVMADTGREATITWDYLHNVLAPYLSPAGVMVEIAPHSLATVDLYAQSGDLLIPSYTEKGKLPTFCSGKWKQLPIRRYLRSKGVKRCKMWLGFSWDEQERAKPSGVDWIEHAFPLLDLVMRRSGCLMLVEKAGLPPPPKSSCWMCPHRQNDQWRLLRDHYPDDFEKACILDEETRETDERGGVYLHSSRVPLRMANLEEDNRGQLNLFTHGCSSGSCWT
jgi:3'-phosphoadenosine 5'-phosphosulfate sulfotransferase (PAPS reductase)/FAD synthetase